MKYRSARFGVRLLAFLIDSFLLFLPISMLCGLIFGISQMNITQAVNGVAPTFKENLIGLGQIIFYFLLLLGFYAKGGTPGKRATHLLILHAKTGQKASKTQFCIRCLGYILSFLTLGIGFLFCFLNKKRRTLGDFLANTVVVYAHNTAPNKLGKQ